MSSGLPGDEQREPEPELVGQLRAGGVRGRLEPEHPLAPHTSYRIGGPAELALFPEDAEDLARAVGLLARQGRALVVLGGGSNVLVSDRGVRGVVILTDALRRLEVEGEGLWVGAGIPSHEVAEAAERAGLAGAEFLAWLPGSVGGACFMNARAYGGEVSQVLRVARVVLPDGTLRELPLAPADFSYKRSPFQGSGALVAEARLALRPDDPLRIRERMDRIGEERRSKHELDHPSCGCVFKNDRAIGTASGALIERCGLKGHRLGDAQVSPYHANFVFNLGAATASEVRAVIEHVQRTVEAETGHRLELEVRLLGEWSML
jgi:UDP-N-acetylmuramate dehydrogenase